MGCYMEHGWADMEHARYCSMKNGWAIPFHILHCYTENGLAGKTFSSQMGQPTYDLQGLLHETWVG